MFPPAGHPQYCSHLCLQRRRVTCLSTCHVAGVQPQGRADGRGGGVTAGQRRSLLPGGGVAVAVTEWLVGPGAGQPSALTARAGRPSSDECARCLFRLIALSHRRRRRRCHTPAGRLEEAEARGREEEEERTASWSQRRRLCSWVSDALLGSEHLTATLQEEEEEGKTQRKSPARVGGSRLGSALLKTEREGAGPTLGSTPSRVALQGSSGTRATAATCLRMRVDVLDATKCHIHVCPPLPQASCRLSCTFIRLGPTWNTCAPTCTRWTLRFAHMPPRALPKTRTLSKMQRFACLSGVVAAAGAPDGPPSPHVPAGAERRGRHAGEALEVLRLRQPALRMRSRPLKRLSALHFAWTFLSTEGFRGDDAPSLPALRFSNVALAGTRVGAQMRQVRGTFRTRPNVELCATSARQPIAFLQFGIFPFSRTILLICRRTTGTRLVLFHACCLRGEEGGVASGPPEGRLSAFQIQTFLRRTARASQMWREGPSAPVPAARRARTGLDAVARRVPPRGQHLA